MKKITRSNWYKNWFDSPYYDLLYKNRDKKEASVFIDRLVAVLNMPATARVLDLACGKGRHAIQLANKGFQVTGIDLSARNISLAKEAVSEENLLFYTHDMRNALTFGRFDYIFNIFTSFGYFETDEEHLKSLQNISVALRSEGTFVLDFLNTPIIKAQVPSEEIKQQGRLKFKIKKQIQKGRIVKGILFRYLGQKHYFEESVRLFTLQDFEALFAKAGLEIIAKYGDYELQPYDPKTSVRLILVAKKRTTILRAI